jgi:hypothetical protein
MQGKHLKLIRLANRIPAVELAKELGYVSRTPIYSLERKVEVPYKVAEVILKKIGIEDFNSEQYHAYLRHCVFVLTDATELKSMRIDETKYGKLL